MGPLMRAVLASAEATRREREADMAGPEQGGIEPRGVRYEQLGRVGHVVLDRPEASNAFDLPAAQSLGCALDTVEAAAVRG